MKGTDYAVETSTIISGYGNEKEPIAMGSLSRLSIDLQVAGEGETSQTRTKWLSHLAKLKRLLHA